MTHVTTELLLAFGAAAGLGCDQVIAVDPHHPMSHPGFQLHVSVQDGVVTAADPRIGLMHRSAEKLFESRDLRQAMLLANRHDWYSPFTSEMTVALAAEEMLGITPPERATWTRMLLAEVERIQALLPFLAPVAGAMRAEIEGVGDRLTSALDSVYGVRMHPGFARIGGVASPIADDDLAHMRVVSADVATRIDGWRTALARQDAGLAIITLEQATGFGLMGPVGRASGLDTDLRRDDPYLAYADLADVLTVTTHTAGDGAARYCAMLDQVELSTRLVTACLDRLAALTEGPVNVPLPKVVRLPEAVTYIAVEGPLGVSGVLLAGAGEKFPLRLKIRSASFATMQAMGPALVGTPLDRLGEAVMSFPVVMGDADR